ncbi:hypothetical protein TS65_08335 [Aneurinibacillus migulanus]|nr:hypothetical protein TS64_20330 [Aneurinibacillus migulanus]KIV57952.1 hypothetical protein TS65_08335 [Aneurinibacillus migulanus]
MLKYDNLFKRRVTQLYNSVNQEMYGVGVRKQQIDVLEDKIVIYGEHKRVPGLTFLQGKFDDLTVHVHAALIKEFKSRLKEQMEKNFGLKVFAILKDYDPETELAVTVIHFESQ